MQLSTTTEVHIFAVCFSLEYTEFALFFMSNNISFKSLEFYGIDSIEPEFSPSVTQYTIHRQAGSNFQFKASLNIEPLQPTEDDGWNFQPYPGRTLEYNVLGTEYKSFWSVDSWNAIGCPPGEEKMYIAVCPTKRNRDTLNGISANFTIITAAMTHTARLACTHPSTHTAEGEFFGGGSGSCSVEMNSICDTCGVCVSTITDHRS